ncbi:MAG TPA: hypothetical protein VHF23_02875 [Gaiellaceae bacterium]|nr:hypothetical protein [Gaiellaceae bacterium]
MALAVSAALAFAAGAACSGSREAQAPAQPSGGEPSPSTSTRSEPLDEGEGWASPEELAWMREFAAWSSVINTALVGIRRFSADPSRRRALADGDEDVVEEWKTALRPLTSCAETFRARVGDPPTERLLEAAGLMEAACEHYARAAEASVEVLEDGESADAREAEIEGEEALTAIVLVNETLPPGEAQSLPIVDEKSERSRINPRYGQAAGSLVDKAVEVRCWSERDWTRVLAEQRALTGRRFPATTYGVASPGGRRVNLAPLVCKHLDRLVYDGERPRDARGMSLMMLAVDTLAHETQHRAGIADEATAECYAIQLVSETARALGADRAYGDALGDLAWETYPELPAIYRSRECREGGELDLELAGRGAWP